MSDSCTMWRFIADSILSERAGVLRSDTIANPLGQGLRRQAVRSRQLLVRGRMNEPWPPVRSKRVDGQHAVPLDPAQPVSMPVDRRQEILPEISVVLFRENQQST